jgi:hypothetical protein
MGIGHGSDFAAGKHPPTKLFVTIKKSPSTEKSD